MRVSGALSIVRLTSRCIAGNAGRQPTLTPLFPRSLRWRPLAGSSGPLQNYVDISLLIKMCAYHHVNCLEPITGAHDVGTECEGLYAYPTPTFWYSYIRIQQDSTQLDRDVLNETRIVRNQRSYMISCNKKHL